MGKRGPKPQAVALKLLRGNPGKRPLNTDAPQPIGAIGPPPDHLEDEAKAEWDRIVASQPPGLMASCDRGMLAAYCAAWALHVQALKKIKGGKAVIRRDGVPARNPWVMIANQQAQIMAQIGGRFGLSPSDRSSVVAGKSGNPDQDSPRRGLLYRGNGGSAPNAS